MNGMQAHDNIHSTHAALEAESDSLWDELSHQQSREIQEHHQRISQVHRPHRNSNHIAANPRNYQEKINANHHGNSSSSNNNKNNNSRNLGGALHQNLPQIETQSIKQAVTDTVSLIATAARNAKETAQRNLVVQSHNTGVYNQCNNSNYIGVSACDDERYTGPYAKMSNNVSSTSRGDSRGGISRNVHNPYEDFGLRESLSFNYWGGQNDHHRRPNHAAEDNLVYSGYYGDHHSTTAAAAAEPLLENAYDSGMDGALGGAVNPVSNANSDDRRFVLLETFRVKKDGWGAVANLDLFFASLYNYYYHRGLVPIIGKGIVELISLFFTLWLSVFLFQYLDWKGLWECRDEETCRDTLSSYILEKPFHSVSTWNFLMVLYVLLFSAYGIFSIATFVTNMKDAMQSKFIFEDKLGISARKLEGGAVEWHEIVKKILELQRSREYRVAIHWQDIKDELVIAQRIMRRENFMIAFFNQDNLDLTIPIPWKVGSRFRTKFYSKSIEWSIYYCVLSYMFNHKYQIRPAFCMDAAALQRRFIICGIAHVIFMPFLLFFLVLHFFLQNVYDFRSSNQYLGPREWSNVAKWTFREFNELPHAFERRLEPSYLDAENYLKLFVPSSSLNSLGRVLVFLSGSLGAVCVALAAVNDAILLHVKILNWNILWYVGILGVVYSVGKGMLPDNSVIPKYHHNLFAEMDAALTKVSSHTHYHPEFWKKRGWDEIVKSAFSELFQYKVKLFLLEVTSIIVAPIILCHSLPLCAPRICAFVQKVKVEVPGAGDHCGFATFDFDLFHDESWEGNDEACVRTNLSSSTVGRSNGTTISHRPKAKMGKIEKSFFNFKTVHPDWKCAASGQNLVDRVDNYQSEQAQALARERQHHIAAANRQIATLRDFETLSKSVLKTEVNLDPNQIDDHYVRVDNKEKNDCVSVELFHENSDGENDDDIDTFEEVEGCKDHQHVRFQESTPTSRQLASRTFSKSNLSTLASVLQYDDAGLSAELNGLLNRSTLDPSVSLLFAGNFNQSISRMGYLQSHLEADDDTREQILQRQYMWLEKYHSSQYR